MVTGKQISQQLFHRMLTRIGLQDKNIIHFAEFFSKFRVLPSSASYPQWMTSISKNLNDRPSLTAVQVHALLKEKARQRSVSLLIDNLICSVNAVRMMLNSNTYICEENLIVAISHDQY